MFGYYCGFFQGLCGGGVLTSLFFDGVQLEKCCGRGRCGICRVSWRRGDWRQQVGTPLGGGDGKGLFVYQRGAPHRCAFVAQLVRAPA